MDSGVSILNFSTLETVSVKPKTLLFVMTSFATHFYFLTCELLQKVCVM